MQFSFCLGLMLKALIQGVLNSFESDIVSNSGTPTSPGDPDLVAAGYTFNQPLDCDIAVYWKPVMKDLGVRFCSYNKLKLFRLSSLLYAEPLMVSLRLGSLKAIN